MKSRRLLAVGAIVCAAAWAALSAGAATISDQLIVSKGPTTCNQTIAEPSGPTLVETPVACQVSALGASATIMSTLPNLLNLKVVLLTEPTGAPLDGTEISMTLPSGKVFLSDLVVAVPGLLGLTTTVALVSDGDPSFATLVGELPTPGTSSWTNFITVLPETGALQNLTSALGFSASSGVTVQVLSDVEVVPEPQTGALLIAGLGLLGWRARGRHRA